MDSKNYYYTMKLKPIRTRDDLHQRVSEDQVIAALKYSFCNYSFSTFPYICHNMNSREALHFFHSGNCIALSMGVQKHLLEHFNIRSILIPASIPEKFSHKDYLKLSHVAVAIPLNKDEYFIADPAFYFLNPARLQCAQHTSTTPNIVLSKNIYEKENGSHVEDYTSIDKIHYHTKLYTTRQDFNPYQSIPENTYSCYCYFQNDPHDSWEYYLTEILNPDEAISTFFINIRRFPFITSCKQDRLGVCTLDHMVRFYPSHVVIQSPFIQNQKRWYTVNVHSENPDLIEMLNNSLWKYCSYNLFDYLTAFHEHNSFFQKKTYYFHL